MKILMMGGIRCGKTSALASMFQQMRNTDISNFLSVDDRTEINTEFPDEKMSLTNKILEMKSLLQRYNPSDFIFDKGQNHCFWHYTMQISIPGTSNSITLEFIDTPGSFFDFGGYHTGTIMEYVEDCDVYIVVVDTPYLMCDNNVACETNMTDSIHSFLTSIDEDGAKLVLFVPVKCEKWIHEGRIGEVTQKVKQIYAPTINFLKHKVNTEISIIPIETIGSIEFSEMREQYVIMKHADGTIRKCSKITDKIVMLSNGDIYQVRPEDKLWNDPDVRLAGRRPSEWFHHSTTKPAYTPHNCEQIALHILRFVTTTARFKWERNLFPPLNRNITLNDLSNTLIEMSNRGLIKDTDDGIERIKIYHR